jgi:hypothetical protein
MGIWNWLFGEGIAPAIADINPSTGLPLVGDIGGVDVAGNPYGVALTAHTIDGFCDAGSYFDVGCDPVAGLGDDWPA